MRIRYLSYLSLGVAAAFLVVATVAFKASTVVALSFGMGIGMLAVSAGLAIRFRKDMPTLVIGTAIAALSAWTASRACCSLMGRLTTSPTRRRSRSVRCP